MTIKKGHEKVMLNGKPVDTSKPFKKVKLMQNAIKKLNPNEVVKKHREKMSKK